MKLHVYNTEKELRAAAWLSGKAILYMDTALLFKNYRKGKTTETQIFYKPQP